MIDDPSEFYDTDDFAITATFGGGDLVGIFSNEYVEVGGIESKRPVFRCETVSVSEGDAITINGTSYAVVNTEPNGLGEILMILKNA